MALAQSPPADPQQPAGSSDAQALEKKRLARPLTPAEERERQIRMLDPLAKTDPADLGQGQGDSQNGPTLQQPVVTGKPLAGSVAESNLPANPRGQGPQVVSDDGSTPAPDYNGPAVLSRSYTLARPMAPKQVKWEWTAGYSEIWDNGLTGGALTPAGTIQNVASFGTQINWAVNGRHLWKRDEIGVAYAGNYNNYTQVKGYSGFNQNVNMDYAHLISRHLSLHFVETGMITSQSYGLENQLAAGGTSIANVNLAISPTTQIFDLGMKQFSSMTELTWQRSARLSFDFGGGFFASERTGAGLIGNSGYQAQSDVNYRLSRKMTVGGYYSFTTFTYSQHIAVSDSDTVGAIYSYAFNRTTQLRTRLGITRIENLGLQTIPINPAIALLIGQATAVIDVYRLTSTSDVSAEVVKDVGRNRTARFTYTHGVAPGNGALLASTQEAYVASFSTTVRRHYRLDLAASKTSLTAVAQTASQYNTESMSASLSRPFGRGLATNFRFDYRRFTLSTTQPTIHNQIRISTGFTWGPGEGKLW